MFSVQLFRVSFTLFVNLSLDLLLILSIFVGHREQAYLDPGLRAGREVKRLRRNGVGQGREAGKIRTRGPQEMVRIW